MASLNSSAERAVRRRDIASRLCAAVFGGYVAAAALSLLLARVLPMSKSGATATAILSTPVLFLAAILWAFAARSPSRAWLVLVLTTLVCAGMTLGLMNLRGAS